MKARMYHCETMLTNIPHGNKQTLLEQNQEAPLVKVGPKPSAYTLHSQKVCITDKEVPQSVCTYSTVGTDTISATMLAIKLLGYDILVTK